MSNFINLNKFQIIIWKFGLLYFDFEYQSETPNIQYLKDLLWNKIQFSLTTLRLPVLLYNK